MKADIKIDPIYRKKRFWAGILLAQFLLFYMASKVDSVIGIFKIFFEIQKRGHQQLFAWVPFSIGDVFYIVIIGFLISSLIQVIRKKERSRKWVKILMLFNILYFAYQIFWGMLYFQKPLRDQLPEKDLQVEEMKILTLKYLPHLILKTYY